MPSLPCSLDYIGVSWFFPIVRIVVVVFDVLSVFWMRLKSILYPIHIHGTRIPYHGRLWRKNHFPDGCPVSSNPFVHTYREAKYIGPRVFGWGVFYVLCSSCFLVAFLAI